MIFFIFTKVGGKCECNGHSNVCIPSDPEVIISTSSYSIYLKGQCHEIFCYRYQRHRRQIWSPVPLVLLIPAWGNMIHEKT